LGGDASGGGGGGGGGGLELPVKVASGTDKTKAFETESIHCAGATKMERQDLGEEGLKRERKVAAVKGAAGKHRPCARTSPCRGLRGAS